MYITEITGRQILNAIASNNTICARTENSGDGFVYIAPLISYLYTADDQPCVFTFVLLPSNQDLQLGAIDIDTPLSSSLSPDPRTT